jgi:large subunit ribosomal protein LP2
MTAVKYYCAYMLAHLGGDANPSVEKLSEILGAVGIVADEPRAASAIAALAGQDVDGLTAAAFICLSPFGAAPARLPVTTSSSVGGEESSSDFEQPILVDDFSVVD